MRWTRQKKQNHHRADEKMKESVMTPMHRLAKATKCSTERLHRGSWRGPQIAQVTYLETCPVGIKCQPSECPSRCFGRGPLRIRESSSGIWESSSAIWEGQRSGDSQRIWAASSAVSEGDLRTIGANDDHPTPLMTISVRVYPIGVIPWAHD